MEPATTIPLVLASALAIALLVVLLRRPSMRGHGPAGDDVAALRAQLQEELGRRAAAEAIARKVPELERELAARAEEVATLRASSAELQARMEAEAGQLRRERELYERTQREMQQRFEEHSAKALARNNEQFLQLAKQELERQQVAARGDMDKRQAALQLMVKPLGEALGKVEQQFQQIEKDRVGSYERLLAQVRSLEATTSTLATALRAPKTRGSWGELQLQRVVEMAGMTQHCDFSRQVSVEGEEGRLQPDLVVHLAGGRDIVVDAKTPWDSYVEALEAADDDLRAQRMAEHAARVRQHIKDLSRKEYASQFECATEFVMLFIPAEGMLGAALEADPSLVDFALQRKVVLATPTTMITMLWAAAHSWQEQALAQNALAISAEGTKLYDAVVKVAETWNRVGRSLDAAVTSYGEAVGSLERNLLPKARRLRELHVKSAKELPELRNIETSARMFTRPELSAADVIEDAEVIEAPSLEIVRGVTGR